MHALTNKRLKPSLRQEPRTAPCQLTGPSLRHSASSYHSLSSRPIAFARVVDGRRRSDHSELAYRSHAVAGDTRSDAELFIETLEKEDEGEGADAPISSLSERKEQLVAQVAALQRQADEAYRSAFKNISVNVEEEGETKAYEFPEIDERSFGELGRSRPEVLRALLSAKEKTDPEGWFTLQSRIHELKLQRSRSEQELGEVSELLLAADRARLRRAYVSSGDEEPIVRYQGKDVVHIVLITGFESFNVDLYKRAGRELSKSLPYVQLQVFSDRDISSQRARVEEALKSADVFFGSLLFDYDQVDWLRNQISAIPVRLVFESALELMGCTQVGNFRMNPSGKSSGPPPIVKKVLSLFGSGREEDKMVGYLSFLKVGPKLLKFIPGKAARDLRNWLTVYGYWNQGGLTNVVAMFTYLTEQYFKSSGVQIPPVIETPQVGCLHPDYSGYFSTPAEYMAWYRKEGPLRGTDAPVVAVILYRKHVITAQQYIPELIRQLEEGSLIPLPIFINGVEAHTVVRDLLTSAAEQKAIRRGGAATDSTRSLRKDAVPVDAFLSTIGFPLVGGPAGSMEGGRQVEVAKAILSSKNVPYFVAAPLLIQDLDSWTRGGVSGLQSVVLYALPELDGAIDTVPLGGLVGDDIFLIPERVKRLAARIRRWASLRRKPPAERKVAVLLYGFPPGVGATGTAALLNVPRSLGAVLAALHGEGYDLGEATEAVQQGRFDGEALVGALKTFEDQRVIFGGAAAVMAKGAGEAEAFGARAVAAEVTPSRLRELLTYPPTWGPSEWGPIPFLPDNDVLLQRMERQWGDLGRYRGIMTTSKGNYLVPGVQLGNVWVGVQPLLGIEGDPMRLLFERDLTPHPQYAAAYKWIQEEFGADVLLHFGMHGTVEWLPGSPLGNSGLSWSDVLLGVMPNVYVYAANNPSESIVAKRRGYGTIVSHNVPPYGRAGLYKQLSALRELLGEYRESPAHNDALRGPILDALWAAGLQEDCPFETAGDGRPARQVTADDVDSVTQQQFQQYAERVYAYLQVVENRLFSEGLHVLGLPPDDAAMSQYLAAYFGAELSEQVVAEVVQAGERGEKDAAVRRRLEAMKAAGGDGEARVREALRIASLLRRNTEELRSMLAALRGEYVLPEAGGDLLRDGAGVLPTGRNIHALDPYRMPSAAAQQRGAAAAAAVLEAHRAAAGGAYPETLAVNLWGLDAIKTRGESVAMALHLVGGRPVKEGTGRVARFELIPLEELGRPRVDVLCNMSGIFRDSFQNVVELLDDLFQRAAAADEPPDMNFVRKHALQMKKKGLTNPAARLFSNPAGDYGSMVNERVGAASWESGEELGDTWAARNAFSYGKGGERGTARPEVLRELLSTTERVVQTVDSVEYGLTDIQEYYANTGALKRAATTARGGAKVGCSVVEAFGRDPRPRELEEVLRLEYRSKLLNPRWAQAMAAQGSGGAFEISSRMTAMLGWGATAGFAEDWTWDQAADTYALDADMADKLRKANPQAFANVLKRMLEAAGRGMWKPGEDVLERLRTMYADMDDELEGVKR